MNKCSFYFDYSLKGEIFMLEYTLTVFTKKGEKLLDENFQAENDADAKVLGTEILIEHDYKEHTHRCVYPTAKLVLFHR